MMYELRNSTESSKRSMRAIVVIGICIGVAVLLFFVREQVHSIFGFFRRGVVGGETSTTDIARLVLMPKKSLARRVSELETKLRDQSVVAVENKMLVDENKSLRELLAYYDVPRDVKVAGIIGGVSRSFYNRIIIDQGSEHGIVVGDRVGLHQTIVLGEVITVTPTTAVVELYSSPRMSFSGILRTSGIAVPVVGDGGGNFQVQVPRDVTVEDEDVITHALVPDMAVAVIKSVTFDPRDPTQAVRARAPVNVEELQYVEVYHDTVTGLLPLVEEPVALPEAASESESIVSSSAASPL